MTATDSLDNDAVATVDVTVNAAPSVSLSGSTAFCAGSATVITATASGGTGPYTSYDWGASTAGGSGTGNTFTATSGGTVSVTVIDDNGCTGSATVGVTENAIPDAPTAGSNSPICAGGTLNLTASTVAGATYSWTGPNGFTSTLQNPTIPSATTAASGTYSVTADVSGCPSPAKTTVVTVNALPAAPTASAAINPDKSFTLAVTSDTSGLAFEWFTGSCGASPVGTGASISVTPAATTAYYVRAANASGCVGACGLVTVTVNAAPVSFDYTLPGSDGLNGGYRMFTVPLYLGKGSEMLAQMEAALGAYHPGYWRVFAYNGSKYLEIIDEGFASLDIVPGTAFWIITLLTDVIRFEGTAPPDGVDYRISLSPGWHLIGLPWLSTNIDLGNIRVTNGINEYAITDDPQNTLTQRCVWEYTGGSGYVRCASTLRCGAGYFLKVLAGTPVTLIIPSANTASQGMGDKAPNDFGSPSGDSEDPPPPPGSQPIPGVTVNGQERSVTSVYGTPVSVAVTLDPGVWAGRDADWWVGAHTPFATPYNWYSYVHPTGWRPGIHRCVKAPLFEIASPFNVWNAPLPPGRYTFYFAVDGDADGAVDATLMDSVDLTVE